MKKLLALMALVLALAAVVSSGALSQATLSGRQMEYSVQADNTNGYVKLSTDFAGLNRIFVREYQNGLFTLKFGDTGSAGGLGVNTNAESWFDNTFSIRNQSVTLAKYWFDTSDPRCRIYWQAATGDALSGGDQRIYADSQADARHIASGKAALFGVYLDSRDLAPAASSFTCSLTIHQMALDDQGDSTINN